MEVIKIIQRDPVLGNSQVGILKEEYLLVWFHDWFVILQMLDFQSSVEQSLKWIL